MRRFFIYLFFLIRRFLDDIGGEGVVAGNTDGVAGQGVWLPPGRTAAGHEEVAQCGEEDLAVRSRHQVVEDRIDCRAYVKQDIRQHVEVVVEVEQVTARNRKKGKKLIGKTVINCGCTGYECGIIVKGNRLYFSRLWCLVRIIKNI